MSNDGRIQVVTGDPAMARRIASLLQPRDQVSVQGSLAELEAQAARQRPAVAVVDIDPDPLQTLSALAAVIGRWPETKFIVVCSSMQTDLLLEAMQIGARHFLQKTNLDEELPATVRRLTPVGAAQNSTNGAVLTVLSASGGCGSTTLAVNLANELKLSCAAEVLLVDMDLCYGAIAPYLGVEGSYGLADVLAFGRDTDPQLVQSSAQSLRDGLHVLLSPASVDGQQSAAMDLEKVATFARACRQSYRFSVIDAPHLQMPLALKLAAASDLVLIVLQMTVKDIQYARNLTLALGRTPLPAARVIRVINRYSKKNRMISFEECQQVLGKENLELVRNDYRGAVKAINLGKPLAEAAAISPLRKDVRRLAEQMVRRLSPGGGA